MLDIDILAKTYALIFDLDGTLVDSAPDLREAVNGALKTQGLRPLTIEESRSFIGNGMHKFCERALIAAGGPISHLDEFYDEFQQNYVAYPVTKTRLMPAISQTLTAAKNSGFRLGICTNKAEAIAREILDQLQVIDFFDSVVGSIDGRPLKPHPEPLRICGEQLGVGSEQIVLIGDSAADVQAARNASMHCVLIRGGYTDINPDELEANGVIDRADHIFNYLATIRGTVC